MIELTIGGQTKKSKLGSHPVTIDWEKLPQTSQDFIIRYGLKQYIADGMAGAESVEAAGVGVADRVRKLKEADFSRAKGEGLGKPDTEETRALKLARVHIRAALKAANATAGKDAIDEAAKELANAEGSDFRKEARKQLADEAKTQANLATAGGDILKKLLASAATGA